MARSKTLKTDIGTVLLHWLAAIVIGTLTVTGFAIAADAPHRNLLRAIRGLLPIGDVWWLHTLSGAMLIAIAAAYAIYAARAGLSRRIRLDRPRLLGLRGGRRSRWLSINVLLYWFLFFVLTIQIGSGVLLYLGYGGVVVTAHFWGATLVWVYVLAHVTAQYAYGQLGQVLRIVRPGPLVDPGPPPSLIDLIRQHLEQEAPRNPAVKSHTTLHAHPLALASAVGLTAMAFITSLDFAARDKLIVHAIATADAPRLDGDLADAAWRAARPVVVNTQQGVNFGGSGASTVNIRAVHDGTWVFFAFTWDDPTRSLKHLPLVKKPDGWHLLHTHYDIEDENSYYEDKFAVMLAQSAQMPAAGTIHLGARPIVDKPASSSGRGLHYTLDGSVVDVWQWKAVRGGLLGWMDDNVFGPPLAPTAKEADGQSRYKAGYTTDPGTAFYSNNFDQQPPGGYAGPLVPKRLPKDLSAVVAAMGTTNIDPDASVPAGARWWMTTDETIAYSAELDRNIPVGTVMPGILIGGEYTGDRADVRCAAQWAAGRWTLEVARRIDTGHKNDVAIKTGVSMWVSAFDHSQTRHTRHMRPIQLEVEK
jgi:Ethylbenzene dehydrogenase/Prokaryotic cytochrome b561